MIGRTQLWQLSASLMLGALAACSARPKTQAAPLAALRGAGIHIQTTRSNSGAVDLWFRCRPDGPAVARLRGVQLTLEHDTSPQHLPFVSSVQKGQFLELTCGPRPNTPSGTRALLDNHAIVVRLRENGFGQAEIKVHDHVTLRSGVQALTLDYEFLPSGSPDEIVAPYNTEQEGGLIGDIAFASPVTLLRRGSIGFAVLPNLSRLLINRRMPHALWVTSDPQPTIRYGLTNYTISEESDRTVFSSTAARPSQVRNETLTFEHSIRIFDAARPHSTADQLHREAWERYATASFRRSSHPLRNHTTDDLIGKVLANALRSERGTLPFETSKHAIRTAAGLALATSRGLGNWQANVEELVDALLCSPHRGTLFPCSSSTTYSSEDAADAAHAAMSGFWLLQIAPQLDTARQKTILRHCDDLARFLRANQVNSGFIPTRYDQTYWQSQPSQESETAFPALFLAEHGIQRDNRESLDAAARAVDFLQAKWASWNTAHLDRGQMKHGQMTALLPLVCASATAIRLAETQSYPAAKDLATGFLERLIPSQQLWSPNWLDVDLQFGFRADHRHIHPNDPISALAGAALVGGYRLTGRKDFLQRGVQALRAAIVNETGTWTPASTVAETDHWGRTTAATMLQRVRSTIGQGVVDVIGGFAEGVDALWFEDLVVDEHRIAFRLLTHADFDQTTTIRFRNLPDDIEFYRIVINGHTLGKFDRAALENGVEATPHKVGLLRFQPPPYIRADHEWTPRAIVDIPIDPNAEVYLEVRKPEGTTHRVALSPQTTAVSQAHVGIPRLHTLEPSFNQRKDFTILGPREGEHFDCRLVWRVGNRIVHVPESGYFHIDARASDCLDLGDGDELEVIDKGNSRVSRFTNGQEAARILTRAHADDNQASLTCCLPIAAKSTAVTIRIHASGNLLVLAGPQRHEVHRGESISTNERTITIDLTDSRLWRSGHLDLQISPVNPGEAGSVSIARIDFAGSGQATRSTPMSAAIEAREPPPRIRALVIPIALTGTPLRSDRTTLEQAFFGGNGYHRTPLPESRLTEGSVATLIKDRSGGLTEFTGTVAAPIDTDLLASQIRNEPVKSALELVGATLSEVINVNLESYDVIVAVYSGAKLPQPFDGHSLPARFGRRIVFLPETADDGSYLPSGTALLAVLREMFGLVDYASPEHGNFGTLALSATGGGHTPPAFLGMNRLRLGWTDKITLSEEQSKDGPIRFFLPFADHSVYELPFSDLPGRGQLLIEVRNSPAQPLSSEATGALVYWKFAPGHQPITIGRDGSQCSTDLQRLSAKHSSLATPFKPGSQKDIITEAARLNDASSPSIATPEGEILWTIHDLQSSSEGVSLRLTREGLDLLTETPAWRTGRHEKHHLLTRDGRDRGLGTARKAANKLIITTGSPLHWQIRAEYQLPPSSQPQRLFLCFEHKLSDPTPWISIRLDGSERMFGSLQPMDSGADKATNWFQVDFPRSPQGGKFELVLTNRSGQSSRVDLTHALLVPITQRPQLVQIDSELTSARLMDGVTYGEVMKLSTGKSGRTTWRIPVVLPKGDAVLLLKAGLTQNYGGGPLKIRASLRTPDGKWTADVLDTQIGDLKSNTPPVPFFRAAISNIPDKSVAFLDLTIEGMKDQSLFLVSLAIDRP